jgi:23S rRNA (adenine1618-N6)-methyltransferase
MERARSLYKNDIDFAALALQSRDFAKQYVSLASRRKKGSDLTILCSLRFNGQLDFHDEAAVR